MSTSRPYHHGDLRAALIATTRTLLGEVGLEGLNLREASRRTGVSHAAAYNHFRDKASLVGAVVDAAFARLAADLRRARASARTPLAALSAIGIAYVRFAYRNPAEFRIMFRPELSGKAPSRTHRESDSAYAVLRAVIAEAQAAEALAPGPSEPLVLAAWSMVHGLASLIVDGPNADLAPTLHAAEKLARSCTDAVIHGLAKGAPASR